uniref:Uncharacterized protein n=1 Tax=Zea mays TaxID=4577 RepID=A0A804QES9_MAIZE
PAPARRQHLPAATVYRERERESFTTPVGRQLDSPSPPPPPPSDDGASVGGRAAAASSSRRRRGRRGAAVLLLLLLLPGRVGDGGGVVRRQLRDHGRRGPREDLRRRADLVPIPRQQDRRRVPDEAALPVRLVQHEAEAGGQRLRGRRHRLLHVLRPGRGAPARRAGLRVPGQPQRGALHHPDQRVPQRRRRPGDAPLALVRPHRRLPHLRHPLEPQADRVLRGQGGDPGVPERRVQTAGRRRRRRRLLPDRQAHVHLFQHLERGRLGDARRAGEDGLGQGALRVVLPRLRRRRLRLAAAGRGGRPVPADARVRRGHGGQLVGPAPRVGAGRRPAPGQRLGGKEPPRLRLLRRPQALPDAARGVQAPARRDRIVIILYCWIGSCMMMRWFFFWGLFLGA